MAAYQAGLDEIAALETRLATKRRQLDNLTLRAPASGQIIGRDLASRLDTYLDAGGACLAIGEPQAKEIQFCIRQPELDTFKAYLGRAVSFYIPRPGCLTGRLRSIDPRAKRNPPHRSLLTTYGGPLKPAAESSDEVEQADDLLAEPHFIGTLELAPSDAVTLAAGSRCWVTVRSGATIGEKIYDITTQWIRGKLKPENH
jgi:hypothetical protein